MRSNRGRLQGQFAPPPAGQVARVQVVNIPPLRLLSTRLTALLGLLGLLVCAPATSAANGPLPLAAMGGLLPPATLAAAAELARSAAAALAPAGARVWVQAGTLDPRLQLAACDQIVPYLPSGVPVWGRTRVGLRCTDGRTRWNVFLPVAVQVWAPAVVLTSALPAGARLTPEQLSYAQADWAAGPMPPLTDPGALAGRTLARAVAAGQPLQGSDLQARQWFAAGDTVRVLATGGGYSVSTQGRALGAGVEGRPVRVQVGDERVVQGRATAENLVEVGP